MLYDGVLGLDLRPSLELIGYADDLAILASALAVPDLETAIAEAIDLIQGWMKEQGLALAPIKTVAIMFSGRRYADLPEITVEGHQVLLARELKYLGSPQTAGYLLPRTLSACRRERLRRLQRCRGSCPTFVALLSSSVESSRTS